MIIDLNAQQIFSPALSYKCFQGANLQFCGSQTSAGITITRRALELAFPESSHMLLLLLPEDHLKNHSPNLIVPILYDKNVEAHGGVTCPCHTENLGRGSREPRVPWNPGNHVLHSVPSCLDCRVGRAVQRWRGQSYQVCHLAGTLVPYPCFSASSPVPPKDQKALSHLRKGKEGKSKEGRQADKHI